MMSYQARRAKCLVEMLQIERPGIMCLNNVKIAIASLHEWSGIGIYSVGFGSYLHLGSGNTGLPIHPMAWATFSG